MIAWLWRSRLTWRAAGTLTGALCVMVLAATGIGARLGVVVLVAGLCVWAVFLSRMFDNEARHVAAVAKAKGRTPPARRVGRLLVPWWARAGMAVAVLAATVAAAVAFERDGLVVLTLAVTAGAAWLLERAVIALRS